MSSTLKEASDSLISGKTAEVKLLLSHTSLESKVIIIVEGDDDKKLYQKLFHKGKAQIHPLGGCNALGIVLRELVNDYADRIIALKDSDFGALNKAEAQENMFLTDGHDMEMMIADAVFEGDLQREFLDGESISLIESVECDIRHLSYIKWLNAKKQYNVAVQQVMPVNTVYDGNSEIPISKCLEQIYLSKSNADKTVISAEEVVNFENTNNTDNYADLTNGHDLFEGICRKIYYQKEYANYSDSYKPNNKDISRIARASYNIDRFSKTKMYKNIRLWQERVQRNILV